MIQILITLSYVPLFLYLVDGYYQRNVLKGGIYIGVFLLFFAGAVSLVKIFEMDFVIFVPFLIFLGIFVGKLFRGK